MTETSPLSATVVGEQLPALDQRTTSTEVQRVLRLAILDGTFSPGSQLREARLAAELGVSRAPLREAFTRLEEEGLINRVAFRGAFVTEVSETTVAEIAAIRFLVEPHAAQQSAQRLGQQLPARLGELVSVLRAAADADDRPAAIEAHLAFHRFFYHHSGNQVLARMWDNWEIRLRLFLVVDHQQYDNLDEVAVAHEQLAGLVYSGQIPQFSGELARHVRVSSASSPL